MGAQSKKNAFWFTLGILAVTRPGFIIEKIPFSNQFSRLFFFASVLVLFVAVLRRFTASDAKRVIRVAVPFCLYSWIIVVTITNDGLIMEALYHLLYYIYCLLFGIFCMKKDERTFLRCVRNILFVLIIVNTASIILKPDGLYTVKKMTGELDNRYWFLGFKNGIGKYNIFLISISGAYQQVTKNKSDRMITLISFVACAVSSILIGSTSGLIGALIPFLISIMIASIHNEKIIAIARMRNYSIIIALVFVCVVITNSLLTNPLVVYFITEVFGKTITLSGRLAIWNSVMNIIAQHFWCGVGYLGGLGNARLIGETANTTDAHNYYLEFMLEGGMIAGILLALFLVQITLKLDKHRHNSSIAVLAGGMFTIMLVLLTENCNNNFMWLFFGICLATETIEETTNMSFLYDILEKLKIRRASR